MRLILAILLAGIGIYAQSPAQRYAATLSPQPWTPAQLGTSLALWLDAADSSTITLNGSNVSAWADKSGNGRHVTQGTESNQPVYTAGGLNGIPVLTFGGSKMLLTTNSVVSGNPDVMIAAVVNYAVNNGLNDRVAQLGSGNGTTYGIAGGSDGYSSRYNNGNEIYGAAATATPIIQIGTRASGGDYAAASMFVFGAEKTATASTNPTATPNIGNGFSVGGGAAAASPLGTMENTMNGYIAEVVVVNSTSDRQRLEGYLAHKWGLQDSLPLDHPYKSKRPAR